MRPFLGIGLLFCGGALALAGMVAGSGCTVLTNDSLPDDAGKFDGTTDGATLACATCLADQCTGQWSACLTDPACVAVAKRSSGAACVASDPDASADAGSADPLALYGAFTDCNQAKTSAGSCSSDCAGTSLPGECAAGDGGAEDSGATDASDAGDASDDGAVTDASVEAGGDASASDAATDAATADASPTPVVPSVDNCTSCVSGKCGDAKKACAIGSECAAYLECTFEAADAAAADECGRQHATGKTAAVELATCTRVGCSDACGF